LASPSSSHHQFELNLHSIPFVDWDTLKARACFRPTSTIKMTREDGHQEVFKMARKDALLRLTSRLISRRDALRKALNGDLDSFRKFSELNAVGDNVDAAVDCANDEICSQLVEIESRELGQIEHALQRIAGGVYGRCEYCGGKIAEPRLNALPYTNSCIDCQRENERTGQARGLEPESKRWAKVYDKPMEEGDSDSKINLSDFEMDFSETGR
jgi:RNA polymerase-binding transcription factor